MTQLVSSQPIGPHDQIADVTTYQGATSLCIHAMGFLEIAAVASHAALEYRTAIDAITPSIIYAIRHATELFIKYVATELSEIHKLDVSPLAGHDLQQLFKDQRDHITGCLKYEAEHDEHADFDHREWIAEFSGIIWQVHVVDPDGQTLRYPENRKGVANLDGRMVVSVGQLEQFARHAETCFSRFVQRKS